ncbi:MAG: type I DNA topoisomerase [Actinomycetes bacterium]
MSPSTESTTARRLVIVESPAKAKTIKGYLGRDYVVESSVGHIRDLPSAAAEIPAKFKKEKWARLGVNTENGFEPLYVVDSDKKKKVSELRALLADCDELYLATDEDREGEAIAWHLREVLEPTVPVRRMVFHEITRDAILRAIEETRDLDLRLVDAQETRRILDRLYGYEVSPVLWKKVMPRLSAGRVQSVATRLVVERERERIAFRSAEYWDVEGTFAQSGTEDTFTARLVGLDGRRIATGRDFASDGRLRGADVAHLDEPAARGLASRLESAEFAVRRVEEKPYSRKPAAPFMTSTLQQEASRKLRFGSQTAMRVAQRLYENGYITYMRTDSTTLSTAALNAARAQARDMYGPDYVPDVPRTYERKVKNAQEAHEAIRPAGDTFRTPAEVSGELTADEFRLYELIWKRTVASQMTDARGRTVTLRLGATSTTGEDAEFSVSGTVITFRGFLAAYEEGTDEDEQQGGAQGTSGSAGKRAEGGKPREQRLPDLHEGDPVAVRGLEPQGHTTNPPARYTEASLVKALEERGIGRPSTFASIMSTILDRGYVFKKGTALVPAWLAFAVIGLLEQHFSRLVDYDFTAAMEEDLDRIASGHEQRLAWLTRFYFGAPKTGGDGSNAELGPDAEGLKALVSDLGDIDAREVNSFPVGDGIVARVGRYGPYVERDSDRASIPDDLPPDELTTEEAERLLAAGSGDRYLGVHPESGHDVVARTGRFGPYVTEVMPDGSKDKPRRGSVLQSMDPLTITLDDALKLLSLPRVVGTDPKDGDEVTAQNGRYGPYVKKGTESRSLETEEQIFTVTLDEALALLAQPKARRGRQNAANQAPLRELGSDPSSGQPVVVKDGRFGPYVTDGETNASLRKGDEVDSVTIERAAELLADRRARGPVKKKSTRKPAKKSPGKRPAKRS